MGDVECPTCGAERFASKSSMKIHHSRVHGESIRDTVELNCRRCGATYERHISQAESSKYCSVECQYRRGKTVDLSQYREPLSDRRREQVLTRDGFECQTCGSGEDLHIHHIIPRNQGGSHDIENLVTLCSSCHSSLHASGRAYDIIEEVIGEELSEDITVLREHHPDLLAELREVVCDDPREADDA